jgi:hypothetical protein
MPQAAAIATLSRSLSMNTGCAVERLGQHVQRNFAPHQGADLRPDSFMGCVAEREHAIVFGERGADPLDGHARAFAQVAARRCRPCPVSGQNAVEVEEDAIDPHVIHTSAMMSVNPTSTPH